jgi:hypothetical protein
MATQRYHKSPGLDEHTALILIAGLIGLNGVFLWFAWLAS